MGVADKRADGDERALIRGARDESRDAGEELDARYWDDAYRTAYLILRDRYAAEDGSQEALLTALANLGRFRPTPAVPPLAAPDHGQSRDRLAAFLPPST